MEGTIFGIQHYSVHDGPGIRTLVFLKGCPLRCAWCCNPESQAPSPQLRYISFRCTGCHRCMEACPHGAITPDGRLISPGFKTCRSCVTRECIEACNSEALSLSGEVVTSDYVVDRVSADIPFYRNSGGGVTVSGGEPIAQPDFLSEILNKCRGKGIHTAVETCGWAGESALEKVLPFTDMVLFDLKIADPELHLHYTGKPVGPVLLTLALAASVGVPVIIRLPLIPGITDTLPNLEGIARIMAQNRLETIHLLSYHTLGEEKYAEHGLVSSMPVTAPYGKEKLQEIMKFFVSKGFSCSS